MIRAVTQHRYGPHNESDQPMSVTVFEGRSGERLEPVPDLIRAQRAQINARACEATR